MASSYFFLQAEKNEKNKKFLNELEKYVNEKKQQVYVIDRPLGDKKYSYIYKDAIILLLPKYKIIFVDFSDNKDKFGEY